MQSFPLKGPPCVCEFATQPWAPWTAADKECLERVQKRAVKMVLGLREKEYELQLKVLGITTLEERCYQTDLQRCTR